MSRPCHRQFCALQGEVSVEQKGGWMPAQLVPNVAVPERVLGIVVCTQFLQGRGCSWAGQQLCYPRWKSLPVVSSDTGSAMRDCLFWENIHPWCGSTCGLAANSPGQWNLQFLSAAVLISLPAPPATPTCRIISCFPRSCVTCVHLEDGLLPSPLLFC